METRDFGDFPDSFVESDLLILLDEGYGVAASPADEAFEDLLRGCMRK